MDRRGFIVAGIGAALSAALPVTLRAEEPPMSANEASCKFPQLSQIPDIVRICRITMERAAHLLVVFRGFHYVYNQKMNDQEIWWAEQSQLEQYRAMNWLYDNKAPGFDHMMCEEIYNKTHQQFLHHHRQFFRDRMNRLLPQQRRGSRFSVSRELAIDAAMRDEVKLDRRLEDGISTLGRLSAGTIFAYNKNLPALPAGDTDVERKTDEAIASGKEEEKNKWIFNEREKAVFRLAAESKRRVSYVTYGAGHKWTQSLWDWNKENPEQRFSVLTLTTDLVRDIPD